MRPKSRKNSRIRQRIRSYAEWVKQLRMGGALRNLPFDANDPLARLGNELRQLAELLSQREKQFQRLFELIESIEQGFSLEEVLNRIFDGFKGLIPYDRISCAFLSDDGGRLTAYWARSDLGPIQIEADYSQPMVGSSLAEVLRTRQPRIINDLEEYLANKPNSGATKRILLEGGRSSLTCPLIVEHRPIGFLFFTSKDKNTYQNIHQAIFLQIASQVSIIIDKSRVYQQILERNRQLAKESEKFEEAASRDPLTATLNRGAIMAVLERALKARAHSGASVGLIMTDVDRFKNINDTLGHPAGDAVLIEFTHRIASGLRPGDQLGRYGGEEFMIVIPDSLPGNLNAIAEHLRKVVHATPFRIGEHAVPITASFGGAASTGLGATAQDLVAAADRALYAAKTGGRNRVVIA